MLNNLNPIINSLNNKQESTENIKNKGKLKGKKNIENKDKLNNFSLLFNEVLYLDLIDEFSEYEPESLISEIIKKGNLYIQSRDEETLNEYKHLLGGFLSLTINKSHKLKVLKDKKRYDDISEKYYILILNINDKYLALLESLLSSQNKIFSLIKEIEGILLNIKI
jgi:uncharacterized protein YaaR (DUF327 family)